MTFSPPILEVKEVFKHFKDVKAVDGVTINVQQGEFIALLGPNGAGKTTTVEMIEGIQHPDKGEILIEGKYWKHHRDELHRLIGISLQETKFIDKLTVTETLQLFAGFYGLTLSRVNEVIELIGLNEKEFTYVVNLSGGQRQKLAIGIAMLNNAKLLLLDEPTTGLDPSARREIWEILLNLKKQHNISLILTTHYMEEAEYLCDRIIIMDKGQILSQGTLDELLSANNSKEIIDFTVYEPISKPDFLCEIGMHKLIWNEESNSGQLIVQSIIDQLPIFLKNIKENNLNLSSLECRKMTLDDLFISMTGRHLIQS
jgi:ABC-2 type transport system ATP-binding protein